MNTSLLVLWLLTALGPGLRGYDVALDDPSADTTRRRRDATIIIPIEQPVKENPHKPIPGGPRITSP